MEWHELQGEIRKIRKEKGMTQQELSLRTGIPRANIARLETTEQNPTYKTILTVCRALDIAFEPVGSHWIIGTSFIGRDNGILTVWREVDGQKMLEFMYRGEKCLIPAPSIGTRKDRLVFFNLAAEMRVDKFVKEKEIEARLEEIYNERILSHASG